MLTPLSNQGLPRVITVLQGGDAARWFCSQPPAMAKAEARNDARHPISIHHRPGREQRPDQRRDERPHPKRAVKLDRRTKYKGGVFDNRPTRLLETIETRDTDGSSIDRKSVV